MKCVSTLRSSFSYFTADISLQELFMQACPHWGRLYLSFGQDQNQQDMWLKE